MKYLTFRLDVEDGWPPVAAEAMPCIAASGGFRITTPPLFIKGLAVGDQVVVIEEWEGQVIAWRSVVHSGHSTIWVMPNQINIEPALEELRSLGCSTSVYPGGIIWAIDLPPTLSSLEIDERLDPFKPAIAVAYPAWRHGD